MGEAAFKLLEHLTNVVLNELIRQRLSRKDSGQKRFLGGTIQNLEDLLEAAELEQKGGT